jgi:diapolycopene oxygenase
MSPSRNQALVIGAGIAGLAAAIRLALKGYQVRVFETREEPGGKLHAFRLGAYRFDAGPSLFTMPEQVLALFRLAGVDPDAYFRYRRLDDACTYYWPDGVRFRAWSDPERFAREAAGQFGVPQKAIQDYLRHAARLLDTSGAIFLGKPLEQLRTWTDPSVLRALFALRSADLLLPLDQLNRRRLKEPHLVQLFNRFATYNGSDPFRTPGLMAMIAALEHGQGVYYPEGGMVSITRGLYRLALDLGVAFHFGERVLEITREGRRVSGIRTAAGTLPARLVVSNMDIWYTYRLLLPGLKAPERILGQERSSSALVFYWGMDVEYKELGLHNIFFSSDYRGEFRKIFREGRLSDDPTLYVNISSKEAPEDAPPGGENWFVMINAPRHQGQDWAAWRDHLRGLVTAKLERILGRPVAAHIREEQVWDPPGIEVDTLSFQGALYGNSSNNRFAAFLRHPNRNSRLEGLFHVGGTVHPGGGIPLCLLSAGIAMDQVPPIAGSSPINSPV